jgi:NADH-quinone oxidoreductase subunit L
MDLFANPLAPAILFLPLFGCVLIALFGPLLPRTASAVIGCASVFAAFVLTVLLGLHVWGLPQFEQQVDVALGTWAHVGALNVGFGLLIDPLSLAWMLVITGVGFLIHLYSVGYMAADKNYRTFFAYMNLFVFAMLLLVMSDGFFWLLVGWGGVGLASYLLIGFYYDRESAVLAARKALIMNVIGDVGIMIAIFLMFAHLQDISFAGVFGRTAQIGTTALDWIGVWLLVGAVAKSAQLPLHTWLPDAMEGPTPVSALIHAATMVTAGVYLVARCHAIYDSAPAAAEAVAVVGGASALFAATIGCVQYDIKRVLAYSTMSQIGYMFLAVGIGAYSAGIFHFLTHAFFKALLFMAAGIVIHNLGGEQDIRKMGGLAKRMPFAYWSFLIGTLAIAGVPPLSGFFSKDSIIDQASELGHPVLFGVAVAAALLTAFYMFRLLFSTFTGAYRGDGDPHDHPVATMQIPVAILAALAAVGGFLISPGRDTISALLAGAFHDALHRQYLGDWNWPMTIGTLAIVSAGILLAYALYVVQPETRDGIKQRLSGVRALLMDAYHIDALYHAIIEVPAYAIAAACAKFFEPLAIAGVPQALSSAVSALGGLSRGWETGYLRRYGLTMAVGTILLLYFAAVALRGGTPGAH